MYHLAKNTDAQEKLRSEATALLKDRTSPITPETLKNATFTKAVLKETFRMNPISVGIGRILQTDVVLSGYRVPRGVILYFTYKIKSFVLKRIVYLREKLLLKRKSY